MLAEVEGSPNGHRSIRFRGMGSWNGGWLRVVGFFCVCLVSGMLMISIYADLVLGHCGLRIPGCGW